MSERYNDGVLDEKFKNIADKMDDHFEATTNILKDVVVQTTKTNGSVRSLQLWRQFILGGMAVFMAVIVPAVGFLAFQVIKNQTDIARQGATIDQLEK